MSIFRSGNNDLYTQNKTKLVNSLLVNNFYNVSRAFLRAKQVGENAGNFKTLRKLLTRQLFLSYFPSKNVIALSIFIIQNSNAYELP